MGARLQELEMVALSPWRDDPEVPATPANMRKYEHVPGVIAYSPWTAESYSATPGDYWWSSPDAVLEDSFGEPMVLVVRRVEYVSVDRIESSS